MTATRIQFTDQVQYNRLPVSDANATITARTTAVVFTSLTAARTAQLPTAASYQRDLPLLIHDESGSCSYTNTISVLLQSGDSFVGLSSVTLTRPGQRILLFSDGVSKWTVIGLTREIIADLVSTGPIADALNSRLTATSPAGSLTISYLGSNVSMNTLVASLSQNSFNGYHATAVGSFVTGTTNDQTANLQNAVNTVAAAGGGTLVLPPGTAYFDSTVDLSNANNVAIVGSAMGTTLISRHASAALFSAAGGLSKTLTNLQILKIKFDCSVARTSAPLLNFAVTLTNCVFEDIIANNWGSLLNIAGFVHLFLWRWRTQQMTNPPSGGYCWLLGSNGNNGNSGANCSIVGCLLRGNTTSTSASNPAAWTNGIIINNVEALTTKYLDIGTFDRNFFAQPDWAARNMFFEDTYFDASYYGPAAEISGTAICERWSFCNCWFATSGGLVNPQVAQPLLYISNNNVVTTFIMTGCRFFSGGAAGIQVNSQYGFGAQITGCFFHDNGVQQASKDGSGNPFTYAHIQSSGVSSGSPMPALSGCSFLRCSSGYAIIYPSGAVQCAMSGIQSDRGFYLASALPYAYSSPISVQKSSSGLTYAWDVDTSASPYVIPANGTLTITPGSGLIILNDFTGGSVGLFIVGSAATLLVGQVGGLFSATDTGAGSGKVCLLWGGSSYVVLNRTSGSVTLAATGIRTRPNY